MSHSVQINYSAIGVQCESICEVSQKHLAELDAMLVEIEKTSTRLLNSQTEVFKQEVQKAKEEILKRIKLLQDKAEEYKKKGVVTTDSDYRVRTEDLVGQAQRIQQEIDTLASEKVVQLRALLNSILSSKSESRYNDLVNAGKGIANIDVGVQTFLDGISDVILRQFTLMAYLRDTSLKGDELLEAGRAMMSESVEDRSKRRIAEIRAELEAAKADTSKLAEIEDSSGTVQEKLSSIQAVATQEMVGEKVRQKSLKIIMKAITERGFIVDKKNIKIDKEKNEVRMVALKASGERAEFKVYLDGKFIYDFHGYEGQACQKDIAPFMDALEEVYGIHVTAQQEIWSNPDKISTMKYQAMNTNKNRR